MGDYWCDKGLEFKRVECEGNTFSGKVQMKSWWLKSWWQGIRLYARATPYCLKTVVHKDQIEELQEDVAEKDKVYEKCNSKIEEIKKTNADNLSEITERQAKARKQQQLINFLEEDRFRTIESAEGALKELCTV